jgi:hypothetical protein
MLNRYRTDAFDVINMDRAEFLFANTGAGAATVKVYYSPAGTNFVPDTTTYTVAPGALQRIVLNPLTSTRIRITATAAAGGTSATLEGLAVRGSR